MAKKKVFISYRRDDAAGFSHAIHDRLVEFLPDERVFIDVHGIETGADFSKRLEAALTQCGVLLVLIGKRWAGSDESGGSRLQDPQDWVRLEVASALRRGITVIPVLLDGASMPAERTLSEELRPLTRLNADVWDLTGSVMKALGETWPPAEPGAAIYAAVSSGYAFLAGAGLLFVLIAGMFVESVHAGTIFGTALFLVNALVVLRVSIHPRIRDLTRQQALRIGAVLHLVAFGVMTFGTSDVDAVMVIMFGLIPAALLFLAAFAMQHRGKSSAPAARAA
jgi:TIR domain